MRPLLLPACASLLLSLTGCGLLESGSSAGWDSPSPMAYAPRVDDEPRIALPAQQPRPEAHFQAPKTGNAIPAGVSGASKRDAEYRQFLIDRGWSSLLDEPAGSGKRLSELSKENPASDVDKPRSSYFYSDKLPVKVGKAQADKDPKIDAGARKLVKEYLEDLRGFGRLPFDMRFDAPRIHSLHHYQLLWFGFDRNHFHDPCFQVKILATMKRGDKQDWKTLNIHIQTTPRRSGEAYGGLEITRVTLSDR